MKTIIIQSNILKPTKVVNSEAGREVYKYPILEAFGKMKSGDSFSLICSVNCAYNLANRYKNKVDKNFNFYIFYMAEEGSYRFFKK